MCVCVCEKEGVCMATGFNFQEQGVIIGCEHWHCWWEDAESDFLRREAFSPDTHTHTHTHNRDTQHDTQRLKSRTETLTHSDVSEHQQCRGIRRLQAAAQQEHSDIGPAASS